MTAWQPILDGAERDRAWRAIRAVIEDARGTSDLGDGDALTLFAGQPGVALLLATAARATRDPALAELAAERLAGIAERAAEDAGDLYFLTGLTGVAWTIERVNELLDAPPDDDDPHVAIDDAVLELLAEPDTALRFELMKGIAGLGIYALGRGPRASAVRCLERVVELLAAMAERSAVGASWFTPASQLPPQDAALAPNGWHSLGTIHGCLGPIAALAGACGRGVAEPIAGPLLESAIAWLWDQRRRDLDGEGWFAVAPELPDARRTQGWCYGDPGVAGVLFAAGQAANRADWKAMAIELAKDVARRPAAPTTAADPMLCHGTSGVGHILNRLYQASGEPVLRAGAITWLMRSLDQHREGGLGLVDGSSGVALALLAAVDHNHPVWDRALILTL